MKIMKYTKMFVAMVMATAAFAQLVQVPSAAPPSGKKKTGKEAVRGLAPKKGVEKDLNDTIGAPGKFVGGLIDRKRGTLVLAFAGSWGPAPDIGGGSNSITYSKRSAVLGDFLKPESHDQYIMSFNLGQKDGKLLARLFRGSSNDISQMDEGYGVKVDGVWRFDMDGYILVFKEAIDAWKPKSIKLYLWSGNDVQVGIRPASKLTSVTPTQVVPTWAGGSYTVLTDGFMGKAYFRFFSGSETYVATGLTFGDLAGYSLAQVVRGRGFESKGQERTSDLWAEGLNRFGTSDYRAISNLILSFKKDWDLQLVTSVGEVTENGEYSVISGTRLERSIPQAVEGEVLDRMDAGWAGSAGPYSLRRLLLKAYDGSTLVEPKPAAWIAYDGGISAEAFNREVAQKVLIAREEWKKEASDANATLLPASAAAKFKIIRNYPLGWIVPPGYTPVEQSQIQSSDSAGVPDYPAKGVPTTLTQKNISAMKPGLLLKRVWKSSEYDWSSGWSWSEKDLDYVFGGKGGFFSMDFRSSEAKYVSQAVAEASKAVGRQGTARLKITILKHPTHLWEIEGVVENKGTIIGCFRTTIDTPAWDGPSDVDRSGRIGQERLKQALIADLFD